MLSMSQDRTMSSPPPPSSDNRDGIDDRIQSEKLHNYAGNYRNTSADAVLVQPSFDEDAAKQGANPTLKHHQWYPRSPQQESGKYETAEPRNPASPPETYKGPPLPASHTRDLSALFFDSATLNSAGSDDSADSAKDEERKHRRLMSNDTTNPRVAHRRLDSVGNTAAVSRQQYYQHRREPSAGLDILSAAVDATNHQNSEFRKPSSRSDWEPPAALHQPRMPSNNQCYPAGNSYNQDQSSTYQYAGPPPGASYAAYPSQYNTGNNGYPPSYYTHPPGYPDRSMYPGQQYPSQQSMYPPNTKSAMYPPENRPPQEPVPSAIASSENDTNSKHHRGTASTTTGSQTFVTAIAVGGNKVVVPTAYQKKDADYMPGQMDSHSRMSSISSIGFGSFLSQSGGDREGHPLKSHHRKTSSSVSFLNALDIAGMDGNVDETFLRNLQDSMNNDIFYEGGNSPSERSSPTSTSSPPPAVAEATEPEKKLAPGGTSKRIRRKCTISGCPNRVVQGGLCIAHGAKRKTCKHPGCNKNVKKAGLCSTHGPARKKCEFPNCSKVAVQGGKCIAHGARKKLCSVDGCTKQGILGGMCKKHHDQKKLEEGGDKKIHSSSHTRGLSIFHDITADAVESLLNEEAEEQMKEEVQRRESW